MRRPLLGGPIVPTCQPPPVPVALITNYLPPYRMPLYERLAARHELQVLCYGGRASYVPPWFAGLDEQLRAARFPARRVSGAAEVWRLGRRYETIIAPFAGGPILPAAYLGARRHRQRFVLWASVWAQPRSAAHLATLPLIRHIYRQADAVVAYGEHVRAFVGSIRGRQDDVFVAPQAVEAELFGRPVSSEEIAGFRARHQLGDGPLVLYVGRLEAAKGIAVLAEAWRRLGSQATLVTIGDGPLRGQVSARHLGPLPRTELPVAYAAAWLAVLPSIPTPRFREPWGLTCNEAMHQARPVVVSEAVGAAAGGLVSHGQTGLVVPAGDAAALAAAIGRLLADAPLRERLGAAAREAVSAYTYEAMVEGFERAL
jgi:glycosyltransferase involved in cell wall biosynthesis